MSDIYDKKTLDRIQIKHFSIRPLHSTSRNSFCWKHFGVLIIENDGKKRSVLPESVFFSRCIEDAKINNGDDAFGCCRIKAYSSKVSTGNLSRHLKEDHNLKEPEKYNNAQQHNINTFFSTIRPSTTSSQASSSKSNRKWLLARDLVLWICRSLLPFDSVSDEAMVDFFLKYKVILQKEDLPSRTTISRSALDDVYECMKSQVKGLIQNTSSRFAALTTDLWSDSYKRRNYITITMHFLDKSMVFQSLTLVTRLIEGKKTGEKIYNHVQDILAEFNIEEKQIVIVTDSGSNVKRAVSLSMSENHLCLGHGLHNLVVQDGVKGTPEINAIVTKCKKIVKSLRFKLPDLEKEADAEKRRILLDIDEAAEILDNDEMSPLPREEDNDDSSVEESPEDDLHIPSIKTSTPTRWNSILVMLESVYSRFNRNPINNILGKINKSELKLEEQEWKLIGDVIRLLSKFRDAVKVLSASKAETINVALLFRCEIQAALKDIGDDEALVMLRMKRSMLNKLDHRYPINELVIAAALLDCRFQGLEAVDSYLEAKGETRVSFLASYTRKMVTKEDLPNQELDRTECISTTSASKGAVKESSLLLQLSKKYSIIDRSSSSVNDPIEIECWKYFGGCDPMDVSDGNILTYWREKKTSFPWLFSLANAVLCVPATSTPSERVFSVAGLVLNAKRSRLNPSNVDKIIFVHDNYDTCKTSVL